MQFHPQIFQTRKPLSNKLNEELSNNLKDNITLPDVKFQKSFGLTSNDSSLINSNTRHVFKNTYGETPLTFLFFSDKNIENIQYLIRYVILKETGLSIDNQNTIQLMIVMKSIFLQYNNHPKLIEKTMSQEEIKKLIRQYTLEVKRLNEIVINDIVPGIVSQLVQYITYINTITSNDAKLIDRPSATSIKGTREYRDPLI